MASLRGRLPRFLFVSNVGGDDAVVRATPFASKFLIVLVPLYTLCTFVLVTRRYCLFALDVAGEEVVNGCVFTVFTSMSVADIDCCD